MPENGRSEDRVNVALRDPDTVMRLCRMGAFHQTRLSFMRALLRRMRRQKWTFSRPVWRLDNHGVGVAVYTAKGPERRYSLICFSHDLAPERRSDRSIATAWDATFTLFDGVPDEGDLRRLCRQVPKQEAGRISDRELSLSRANRSARLFAHVVERLSRGQQPDREKLEAVGYLMRTTAVYGSGKFGAACRDRIYTRPEVCQPFQVEMLSVYLTRAFSVDIAEHLAAARSPHTAVRFKPDLRRILGVGNATGLGMAPFLVTHPVLINNWMMARERALARVRSLGAAGSEQIAVFEKTLKHATRDCAAWRTGDERQTERIAGLVRDLTMLRGFIDTGVLGHKRPWDTVFEWACENLTLEGQEMVVTLIIEPHGALVDDLVDTMQADERARFSIDGSMPVGALYDIVVRVFGWALDIDFDVPGNQERFWYTSQNKAEPRLGRRCELNAFADLEMPVFIARDVKALMADLAQWPKTQAIARFLLRHPEHRYVVRRVQIAAHCPYSEIRENLLSADILPLDMLRCKLSFFGATRFDPRSDRWTRINMYKNAPFPDELQALEEDNWVYASHLEAT